jgi:hypothetical protein
LALQDIAPDTQHVNVDAHNNPYMRHKFVLHSSDNRNHNNPTAALPTAAQQYQVTYSEI